MLREAAAHPPWATALSLAQKWQPVMAKVIPCQGETLPQLGSARGPNQAAFCTAGCGGLSQIMSMTKPDLQPCLNLN